jgi:6-phosphogluconolactonase (cycloisomerase 2 family)
MTGRLYPKGCAHCLAKCIEGLGFHVQLAVFVYIFLALFWFPLSVQAGLHFAEVYEYGVANDYVLYEIECVTVSPDGKHLYTGGIFGIGVFSRDATTGKLTFVETQEPDEGELAGLNDVESLTVSPDGKHLYAAGDNKDAVLVFSRNATTGKLTFVEVQEDDVGGVDGLWWVECVKVSPDGKYLYAAGSWDDGLAVFSRNATTGKLTFVYMAEYDIISASVYLGYQLIGVAITLSPDGKHLYAALSADAETLLDDALAVFSRNATTGELALVEVHTDDIGGAYGLLGPESLAVSPDGKHLYAARYDTFVVFSRNATTGKLTFVEVHTDDVGGVDGLDGVKSLAVSPDGKHLYAAGEYDDAVALFSRNATTGKLTFVEVHTDDVGGVDGLDGVKSLAVSSDGKHLYAAGEYDDAVALFTVSTSYSYSPASFLAPVCHLLLSEPAPPFVMPPTPPSVTTKAATDLSETGASLEGTVNPYNDSTTAYFEWGETTSYGHETLGQDMGSGAIAVSLSHTLTNLTCNATYHYRAVGSNKGGTTYGEDQIFTTGGCQPDPDVIFFDDFSGVAPYDGSQWNNERGDWSVSNGVYDAGSPSSNPLTYSSANTGDLTDFVLDVDINSLYDGGLWLRSSSDGDNVSGVLLVTGGYTSGYDGLYWHTCSNGSCSEALNVVSGLGLNNSDVHLKVVVQGNEYRVYVNGSNTPATILTEAQFSSGKVGLYDYSSQTFDNVQISQVAGPQTHPFPDTGQSKCYDNSVEITCPRPGEDFYGQDGQHWGLARSYTKLGMNGVELPDTATQAQGWIMTRDNTTGLIWELKTDDGGIHDKDNLYTWCDANPATNGGNQGTCGDGTDTGDFITSLNNANFGGYGDWRLPAVKELSFLVNRSIPSPGPVVCADFFSDTGPSSYWSSSTRVDFPEHAWHVDFADGGVSSFGKSNSYYARAVRSGQPEAANRFVDNLDGTVTDIETGLMWQQATAPGTYTWKQALAYVQTLNSQSFAGHNDWRLPDVNELQSLVDYSQHHPPIDTDFFPDCTTSGYVTSTTDASNTDSAWRVYFGLGTVYAAHELDKNNKLDSDYVRGVRGGKTSNDSFGTILTFDINGMENGDILSPAYGDRVTSASMGPYDSYGGGGGFTPNVEVTYADETGGELTFWTTGYNDLINVVGNAVEFQNGYSITFNADPGYIISLMSLDMGNSGAAITVPGITITDGEGTELFSESNITLDPGSTQTHKTFNFGPSVSSGKLVLYVDTTGLNSDSDNIALDNIHFSQMASCGRDDVIFFDDFSGAAPYDGSQWNNERGDWSVSNGVYDAGSPSSNPLTYTSANTGDLTDFVLEVDINSLHDGGLWLRSSWDGVNMSGVLLVTGGYTSGYDGLYWHTCSNGSCSGALNVVSGLGLNNSDVHLKVVVQGNEYRVYVNGSNTPATTLTDAQFSSGKVGLYDYSSQTFDNVRITQ